MPAPRPDAPASATAIAEACSKAGAPGLITAFLKQRATLAEVEARLGDVWRMRDVAKRANRIVGGTIDADLIDKLIGMDAGLEATKAIYHTCILTRQSPEIINSRPVDPRADHGWGDIIAKQAGAKK